MLLVIAGSSVSALDGKVLYTKLRCASCHGKKGEGKYLRPFKAFAPKLNGQYKEYIFNEVKDIKEGLRSNGNTYLHEDYVHDKMKALRVTDEDLKAVARYIANPHLFD